jgi:hypothetical protein
MNTKKVFFGLLGVAFLAMTVAVATVDLDKSQTTSIEKSKIRKL